jgi:signal transduction histidine kinase/ActR/RegA family two-component response regulator
MGFFIIFFILGTAAIFLTMEQINRTYYKERAELVNREEIIREINDRYNTVFSDIRGYIAFDNPDLRDNALEQQPKIRKLISDFNKLVITDGDKAYGEELLEFTNYYFIEQLPVALELMDSGKKSEISNIANSGTTANIINFQENSRQYLIGINDQLDEKVLQLTQKQRWIQLGLIVFIFTILIVLFRMIRLMLIQIGQPLAEFAYAANEIAKGNEAVIKVDSEREDELGALAVAFKQMIASIQEKEQDLLAHNEELQAQQEELEEALEILRRNEEELGRRNTLINKISTSLDKKEVLESIVINMSGLINADRGMITLIHEDAYAAFGVSTVGVDQYRKYIDNGINERLLKEKKPFSIKREIDVSEKGFHEERGYCYDIFIPVLSSANEVMATMVYSRFGDPFLERYSDEYVSLAKQVGMSLDKINIYERSDKNRRLNQDILNSVNEGIQLIDSEGTIVQVNNQLCQMFECKENLGHLEGLTWTKWTSFMKDFIEDEQGFDEFVTKAKNMLDLSGEYAFTYKKKAENTVVKVYCTALFQGIERVGTIFVHRDITKEFEVDQMKSEFVSTVSHELRTPLASILGFTELILNRELKPEKQKKYLTTIYGEAKRLTALINDFLDLQRMEAGKQTYEKKFIQLGPIIEKVMDAQQVNTTNHELVFENQIENESILGDSAKLEQVFTNLINNAIKYSPDGGKVAIQTYIENENVKIDVTDEGLGIPPDAMEKLFNKFYRVDNSDRRRIGGTGLGLAIVQEIVKSHGGEISVVSQYGIGSTFTVTLPKIGVTSSKLISANGSDSQDKYLILLVEDDQSLAELIQQELEDSGFRVCHTKSGKETIQFLENDVPDAIVLDIMLDEQEIDGWDIMTRMKKEEKYKNIPIIISSALDEKEKGYALGAKEYFIKPYKPSKLSKTIMQTLLKIGKMGQILIPEDANSEGVEEDKE